MISDFPRVIRSDEFATTGIVELPALVLTRFTADASEVVRTLSACHTQASGFKSRVAFLFASGVAFPDVRSGFFRVLQVAGAVGIVVPLAKELTIVEFHGLNPAKTVTEP